MISQSRYIRIVSGVGAGAGVAQRQLILRIITRNTALPPGVIAEFSSLAAVGAYFGQQSEEYARATPYFAFVSKNINSPAMISFVRWVSTPIAPMVVGDSIVKTLASFSGVNAGTLSIISGAATVPIAGISFTTAQNLGDVAAAIQTALRANADPQLKDNSTVTYNSNTNQFVLSGATQGSGSLSVVPTGTANDLSILLGWATGGTVLVAGQAADTPDIAVAKSAGISNNFGSFLFAGASLTNDEITSVAAWTDAQNNMYMYSLQTTLANLQTLYALIKGYSGVAINIGTTTQANDYVEQSPCEILAATNYTQVNATQNYMYYQFPNRAVTVSDDTTADTCDNNRGNYIGVTQESGQQLAFYQRGVLCGGSQAATDMNTYANEMWLKSAITAQLFSLFLSVSRVPADDSGAATILAVLLGIISTAKNNGVISIGKPLTVIQQQYISQISGDPMAWRQVQTIGYWVTVGFASEVTEDGRTEWYATYTLIYSKDDAIRSVQGRDVLI